MCKTGKILHLDGDRKYSQKSFIFYKKLGLNFIVKNIPEYRQPYLVKDLLIVYKPDILVITCLERIENSITLIIIKTQNIL